MAPVSSVGREARASAQLPFKAARGIDAQLALTHAEGMTVVAFTPTADAQRQDDQRLSPRGEEPIPSRSFGAKRTDPFC